MHSTVFRVTPRKGIRRPVSMQELSLNATPVRAHGVVSPPGGNETILAADASYIVKDNTGRLIPVKGKRLLKRASKGDICNGVVGLSSSFHGGSRPRSLLTSASDSRSSTSRLSQAGAPLDASPRAMRTSPSSRRPRSMLVSTSTQPSFSFVETSTPNKRHSVHMTCSPRGWRALSHPDHDIDDTITSSPAFSPLPTQAEVSDVDSILMPPPPPPLPFATSPMTSPRASQVFTNGSLLSYQLQQQQQQRQSQLWSDSDAEPRQALPQEHSAFSPTGAHRHAQNSSSFLPHSASVDAHLRHPLTCQSAVDFAPLSSSSDVGSAYENLPPPDFFSREHMSSAGAPNSRGSCVHFQNSSTTRAQSSNDYGVTTSHRHPKSAHTSFPHHQQVPLVVPVPLQASAIGNIDRSSAKRNLHTQFESPRSNHEVG